MENVHSTRNLLIAVLVALTIRVAVIPFMIGDVLDPARGHWEFGWEEGRIARSIAAGEGFSSPLFGPTGETAWTTPAYPYLLAGVFRVFGIYSHAAAWAILIMNALFSALTCIPTYFVALRSFGPKVALWAAWIWTFHPYAIYLVSGRVWGFCLDALLMALILWCTLALEEQSSVLRWIGYGFLWGVAALENAVILSTLPFLLGWLVWRRHRRGVEWLSLTAASLLTLVLTVTPWFVRNYSTFGRFIPFRATFWMIFWESNTGDTSDLYPDWTNPAHSDAEMEKYRRQGELGYVDEKRAASLHFLRNYPALFLWLTLKRVLYTWTGYWSFSPAFLAQEPTAIPNIGFCSALTILMLLGLRRAWRISRETVVPLVLVLFSYPLVYYITHPGVDYRHPVDPVIAVFLGVFGCGLAARFVRAPAEVQASQF